MLASKANTTPSCAPTTTVLPSEPTPAVSAAPALIRHSVFPLLASIQATVPSVLATNNLSPTKTGESTYTFDLPTSAVHKVRTAMLVLKSTNSAGTLRGAFEENGLHAVSKTVDATRMIFEMLYIFKPSYSGRGCISAT